MTAAGSLLLDTFVLFGLKGNKMTQSREERRAESYIVKLDNAKERSLARIVRELYEEIRPVGKTPVFFDSEVHYLKGIRRFTIKEWDDLVRFLDERGVFNPRLIRSRDKRRELLTQALENLISADIVIYDIEKETVRLSYRSYQLEACRDDAERELKRSRHSRRAERKRSGRLVRVA